MSGQGRSEHLERAAEAALAAARAGGASAAAARLGRTRYVSLTWRDGDLEKIEEATSNGMTLRLFHQGRYSGSHTSDLRGQALADFVGRALETTALIAPDPDRALPDPALYEGRSEVDLQLVDPDYGAVTPDQRRRAVREVEEAARAVPGAERILSVTAGGYDDETQSFQRHSDGFEGGRTSTTFGLWASVTVKDSCCRCGSISFMTHRFTAWRGSVCP